MPVKIDSFIKMINNGGAYNYPEVRAVSIYKSNDRNKAPILIVLHGQDIYYYSKPSGTLYTVKLYQIIGKTDA